MPEGEYFMAPTSALILGGIFNIVFAVFHVLFWRLFDWKHDLASLSNINRQAMQILNICLTFTFLIFAYVSLFHTEELLTTGLGRGLVMAIAIFWFLRALEQVYFFGMRKILSVAFFAVFLLGTALYAYPWYIARSPASAYAEPEQPEAVAWILHTQVAESDETVVVEGNHYFPPESLARKYFQPSDHKSQCPWKGTASYYSITVDGKENKNAAWYYPEPRDAAAEIRGRVAFWKGVQVGDG